MGKPSFCQLQGARDHRPVGARGAGAGATHSGTVQSKGVARAKRSVKNDTPAPGTQGGRYPPARTAPWFFLVLTAATLAMILAGVFRFAPLTRIVHWLAVVL